MQVVVFADESAHPIKNVTVCPAESEPPVVVQVIEGAATVIEVQVTAPPETNLYEMFEAALPVVKPLNANVVADGDAAVEPDAPGNVNIIFPPDGTGLARINETVCIAETFETKTSVPACPDDPVEPVK